MEPMRAQTAKLYSWALVRANSPKAPLWLALFFVLEIFLFIPLDAVLLFFCSQRKNNILLYVLLAAFFSTISGLIGYFFGHFLWDLAGSYVVPHLISTATFDRFSGHLQHYENGAIFFGALLPFPLKVLSLTAGVFHLGALNFACYFALGRLLRFALTGCAMAFWGDKVRGFVDRHFHRLFLIVGAKVALMALFLWAFAR